MKTLQSTLGILILLIAFSSCIKEKLNPIDEITKMADIDLLEKSAKDNLKQLKTTGSVEVAWKGEEKSSEMGSQPENLRAFFQFNAHEATGNIPAKGDVTFTVTDEFQTLHREITATVQDVKIDPVSHKAWFLAVVVSDTKDCNIGSGNEGGEGHDSGCSGGDESEGGCADETNHDGGCAHDSTDDGGCADGGDDDGGCSGFDSGSMGNGEKGNPLSGKNCRIGQLVFVKIHDQSTPGSIADGIAWKWFASSTTFNMEQEPKSLCKKKIIAGNVVIHD